MKLYRFSRTYTDKYIFELEAENEIEAWKKFEDVEKEEAIGIKNIEIFNHLEDEEEVLEE